MLFELYNAKAGVAYSKSGAECGVGNTKHRGEERHTKALVRKERNSLVGRGYGDKYVFFSVVLIAEGEEKFVNLAVDPLYALLYISAVKRGMLVPSVAKGKKLGRNERLDGFLVMERPDTLALFVEYREFRERVALLTPIKLLYREL